MTMEQFQEKFGQAPSREALTMLVGKVDDAADRVLVYFPEGDIGVKECKPCVAPRQPRGKATTGSAGAIQRPPFSSLLTLNAPLRLLPCCPSPAS